MRAVAGFLALLSLAACAPDEPRKLPTPTATMTPTIVTLVAADCPVADEEFCVVATAAANALVTRDAEKLLALSRADSIVCAEMVLEYFPGCVTDDVIEGYGVSGPNLIVNLVTEAEYLVHLRGTTEELQPGTLQILGVGTCGPSSPAQRTYHLSWTGTVVDADGTAIPIVGSFEFNFVDSWRTVLFYVGPRDSWEEEQDDPLHNSFCEAGQTPWLV